MAKKIALLGLILVLTLATISSGLATELLPFPIAGQVSFGGEFEGLVLVTGTDKDQIGRCDPAPDCYTVKTKTDQNGFYQIEWSNVKNFRNGDLIEISICDTHAACKKSIRLSDPVSSFDFNLLTEAELAIKEEIVYVCWDGSKVKDTSSCPIQPKPEEPKEPESKTLQTALLSLIATIIGVFAWGKGFAGLIKYYLKKAKEQEALGNDEEADKLRARAEKMAKTVIFNFMAGKYKK